MTKKGEFEMKEELKEILDKYTPSGNKYSFSNIMWRVCLKVINEVDDIHKIIRRNDTTTHDKYIAYLEMIPIAHIMNYKFTIEEIDEFDIDDEYLMAAFLTLGLHLRVIGNRLTDQDTIDCAIKNCHWRVLDLLNVYFMIKYNYDSYGFENKLPHPLTVIFKKIHYKCNKICSGIEFVDVNKLFNKILLPTNTMNNIEDKYASIFYKYFYDWCFYYFPNNTIKWISKDDEYDTIHTIPDDVLLFLYVLIINNIGGSKLAVNGFLDRLYLVDLIDYEKVLVISELTKSSERMISMVKENFLKDYDELITEVMEKWRSKFA